MENLGQFCVEINSYGHLFPSPDHQKAMAMVEAKLLG